MREFSLEPRQPYSNRLSHSGISRQLYSNTFSDNILYILLIVDTQLEKGTQRGGAQVAWQVKHHPSAPVMTPGFWVQALCQVPCPCWESVPPFPSALLHSCSLSHWYSLSLLLVLFLSLPCNLSLINKQNLKKKNKIKEHRKEERKREERMQGRRNDCISS